MTPIWIIICVTILANYFRKLLGKNYWTFRNMTIIFDVELLEFQRISHFMLWNAQLSKLIIKINFNLALFEKNPYNVIYLNIEVFLKKKISLKNYMDRFQFDKMSIHVLNKSKSFNKIIYRKLVFFIIIKKN